MMGFACADVLPCREQLKMSARAGHLGSSQTWEKSSGAWFGAWATDIFPPALSPVGVRAEKCEFWVRVRRCGATRWPALLAKRCALAARPYLGWGGVVRRRHRSARADGPDS